MPNNRRILGSPAIDGQVLVERSSAQFGIDWETPSSPLVSDTPWFVTHDANNHTLMNVLHFSPKFVQATDPTAPTFININANITGVGFLNFTGSDMVTLVTFSTIGVAIAAQTALFEVVWGTPALAPPVTFLFPYDDPTALVGTWYAGLPTTGTFTVKTTSALPATIQQYNIQWLSIGN